MITTGCRRAGQIGRCWFRILGWTIAILAATPTGGTGMDPRRPLRRENESARPDRERRARHAVDIRSFAFAPGQLTAEIGDAIVFTNRDAFDHTVTANDGSLDSRVIHPRRSWRMAVTRPFSFHCAFHPSMQGSVAIGSATDATVKPTRPEARRRTASRSEAAP